MHLFTHTIALLSQRMHNLPCTWRHNGERAVAINGKTEALRTPPPRWVSAQLLNVWVSARRRSRWCSQNLCSTPFLRAVRFDYLWCHNYIINYLHYMEQFFPYQECNNITWNNFFYYQEFTLIYKWQPYSW